MTVFSTIWIHVPGNSVFILKWGPVFKWITCYYPTDLWCPYCFNPDYSIQIPITVPASDSLSEFVMMINKLYICCNFTAKYIYSISIAYSLLPCVSSDFSLILRSTDFPEGYHISLSLSLSLFYLYLSLSIYIYVSKSIYICIYISPSNTLTVSSLHCLSFEINQISQIISSLQHQLIR